jgi:hypothetical protein
VGDDSRLVFRQKLLGEDGSVETGRCHGEAARSVLSKVRDDVFARLQPVAAKRPSRARNSQFDLLGQILCVTTTAL